MCLVSEPPQCHSDWGCPKKQKCCHHLCGIKCLDPVNSSKSGEKVGSWERGPVRCELEDMRPGEAEGAPLKWVGGWSRVRACSLPSLYSQVLGWSVASWLVNQSISQLMDCSQLINEFVCLFDAYNTSWGSLSGKESPSRHAMASIWVLRWVRT